MGDNFPENPYHSSNPYFEKYRDLAENLRIIWNLGQNSVKMANFEDFVTNFPYPASYLASVHKYSSEGALANKKIVTHAFKNVLFRRIWIAFLGITEAVE